MSSNLLCCSFLVTTKLKGVDLDASGNINGVPVLEVDMESFEEKPWRKPGLCLRNLTFPLVTAFRWQVMAYCCFLLLFVVFV